MPPLADLIGLLFDFDTGPAPLLPARRRISGSATPTATGAASTPVVADTGEPTIRPDGT